MAVFVQDAKALLTTYLAYIDDITYASSSTDEKTAGLLSLNAGYRRYLAGEYVNKSGDTVVHVWSFANQLAQITFRAGVEAYALPDAYEGDVEGYVYDYNTKTVGEKIKIVDHAEILELRKNNNQGGLPTHCTVRAKDFAAGTGSTYEFICYPKPQSATVTQTTTTVTRVSGPDFHSAMVSTTIEITGSADGTVQSVVDADTLVSDQSQTVATATESFYDNGITARYRYRIAMADLTDSASVYPAGLVGCGDLIVQATRAILEWDTAGQDGSETARFYRMMHEMVTRDKKMIPGRKLQRTIKL